MTSSLAGSPMSHPIKTLSCVSISNAQISSLSVTYLGIILWKHIPVPPPNHIHLISQIPTPTIKQFLSFLSIGYLYLWVPGFVLLTNSCYKPIKGDPTDPSPHSSFQSLKEALEQLLGITQPFSLHTIEHRGCATGIQHKVQAHIWPHFCPDTLGWLPCLWVAATVAPLLLETLKITRSAHSLPFT